MNVTTFLAQLRRDSIMNAEKDTQEIFDALGGRTYGLLANVRNGWKADAGGWTPHCP